MRVFVCCLLFVFNLQGGLPLLYWKAKSFENFGDYLSVKIVERMLEKKGYKLSLKVDSRKRRLLAVGSILALAKEGDVIWGTGMNAKRMARSNYNFNHLDVRALRGPKTRAFLKENFNIDAPEIYGDPALLLPRLFPEFKRSDHPSIKVLIIPHYADNKLFPKALFPNVAYTSDPWDEIVQRILEAEFVVSSSLHGVIVAEAFGIPSRYIRVSEGEPLFKYEDYYLGTGRESFTYATSLEEAVLLGGEPPFECDLDKLMDAFPYDYW